SMRFQCRLVPIDFVEVVDVRVPAILQNIEAHAARLIPLGTESIHLNRFQESLARVRLNPDLYPHRQHAASLPSRSRPRSTRTSPETRILRERRGSRHPQMTPARIRRPANAPLQSAVRA